MYLQSLLVALISALLLLPCTTDASTYPVTGAAGFGTHPRLEIRTLYYENPAQWNIYLLALRALYSEPGSETASYFQIAGIHGFPNIAWDGVENVTVHGIGYCAHSSNIFTTWHRPYMALYEQRLQQTAMQEARKFKGADQAKYLAAAKTLRAAYWDWGVQPAPGQKVIPSILTDAKVSVYTPSGHEVIPNPLYEYRFHLGQTKGFVKKPWTLWNTTLRYPTTKYANAVSQENYTIDGMQVSNKGNRRSLFQWYSNCPEWLEIDDLAKHTPKGCFNALEMTHGAVHVIAGGNGHMGNLKYAAFDPLFWVHHSNVDRYFAMWQAINPTKYVVKHPNGFNTFNYKKDEIIDVNTPLTPFHSDDKGTFWTSAQVRSTEIFHYTYPELMHGGNTPAAMRKQINELYGPNATRHAAGPAKVTRGVKSKDLDERNVVPSFLAANGSTFQYIANIASTRFGLGGSYSIYVFLANPVSTDPSTWPSDPSWVGTYPIFSMSGMEAVDIVTAGAVSLTDALNERVLNGNISSMAEEVVVPFLTDKLQWRVVGPAGIELDPASVPSFQLEVVASTLAPNTDPTEFPVWSEFIPLPEITSGKPGGVDL